MNIFIMHIGSNNVIDLDYTVKNSISIERLYNNLPIDAPERNFFNSQNLRQAFPSGSFNCWGIPIGAAKAFKQTNIGDVILIIPEIGEQGGIEYLGIVKEVCPIESYNASKLLWPETPNERLFPWLIFFDTQYIKIPWYEFLADVNMSSKWNPRGWYRKIASSRFQVFGGEACYLEYINDKYKKLSINNSENNTNSNIEYSMDGSNNVLLEESSEIFFRFNSNVKERICIEEYSMNIAKEYFQALEWQVTDVSKTKSFDLLCTKHNYEIHVEVKGTQSGGDKIIITKKELDHAREFHPNYVLFIVKNIALNVNQEEIKASDGDISIFWPWKIEDSKLSPISYIYQITD